MGHKVMSPPLLQYEMLAVLSNAIMPKVSEFLSFLDCRDYASHPGRFLLHIQGRISQKKKNAIECHKLATSVRSRIGVFFDNSISRRLGLNSARLCGGECYTELLSFSSKVKSEGRILLFPSQSNNVHLRRSRPHFKSPKILYEKNVFSEVIAVFLTVPLLLWQTEDINECSCDGKPVKIH